MLVVSAFTFFGLSAIQNISYFTNLFGETKIQVTIANEEENESANEGKEAKGNELEKDYNFAIFQHNKSTSTAFQELLLIEFCTFSEVSTPPPEFV